MFTGRALAGIERSLWPIFVLLLLSSVAVCCMIVASGWRRRRNLARHQHQPALAQRFELGHTPSGMIDVAAELNAAVRRFEERAAGQFTTLEVAVHAGLVVRVDAEAFRAVLSDLVGCAIAQAPCGRVLVSAVRTGNWLQVSVADDGVEADGPGREASLRNAQRLAALHGAIMRVDARPSQGTTVSYMISTEDGICSARSVGEPVDPSQIATATGGGREARSAIH